MEYELNKWDIFTISTELVFLDFFSINRNTTPLVFGAVENSPFQRPLRPGIPLSLKAPSFTDARFTMEARSFLLKRWVHGLLLQKWSMCCLEIWKQNETDFWISTKKWHSTRNVDWRCGDLFLLLAVEGFWMCPGWSIKCLHWLVQLLVSFSLQKSKWASPTIVLFTRNSDTLHCTVWI